METTVTFIQLVGTENVLPVYTECVGCVQSCAMWMELGFVVLRGGIETEKDNKLGSFVSTVWKS